MKLIYVGFGGFIGTALRYLISNFFTKFLGKDFPFGTLVVNIMGCFLIGFIMGQLKLSENSKLFIVIGILGGLTTFSTFAYESVNMVSSGKTYYALLNVLLNFCLCFMSVWMGSHMVDVR